VAGEGFDGRCKQGELRATALYRMGKFSESRSSTVRCRRKKKVIGSSDITRNQAPMGSDCCCSRREANVAEKSATSKATSRKEQSDGGKWRADATD